MNTEQAKAVFNKTVAAHHAQGNLEQAARVELAREYFTNPNFRKALADHLWEGAK